MITPEEEGMSREVDAEEIAYLRGMVEALEDERDELCDKVRELKTALFGIRARRILPHREERVAELLRKQSHEAWGLERNEMTYLPQWNECSTRQKLVWMERARAVLAVADKGEP